MEKMYPEGQDLEEKGQETNEHIQEKTMRSVGQNGVPNAYRNSENDKGGTAHLWG